jgi:hypothetical protein
MTDVPRLPFALEEGAPADLLEVPPPDGVVAG